MILLQVYHFDPRRDTLQDSSPASMLERSLRPLQEEVSWLSLRFGSSSKAVLFQNSWLNHSVPTSDVLSFYPAFAIGIHPQLWNFTIWNALHYMKRLIIATSQLLVPRLSSFYHTFSEYWLDRQHWWIQKHTNRCLSKRNENMHPKMTWTKMFTAALFTAAQTGNSPNAHQQENRWTRCSKCIQCSATRQ